MLELLRDFWRFAQTYRKFWMMPLVGLLLLVGTLVILANATAIGPFIYALF